ncbi:MAG TPA: zinc-binding dehydrogenase, partial [Acidimicrobiales bacterium]|nr:zinc-binding dehydrogenase [Acidimicrobiales bacterium]
TGRAALFFGPGKPFQLTELPVPEPEPGAVVVRVTRANVCGSDLHIWRGDGALGLMARDDGRIIGHEMTGVVHALGEGVERDWAGRPLAVGDRVVYQYFAPCGRCRSCARGMTEACARSFKVLQGKPTVFPHFRGAYADYFYVTPQMAIYKVPDAVTDTMVAGVNCALAQVVMGLERVQVGLGDTVVIQGAGGLGIYATAVARDRGADRVVVIDGLPERLELARAMGADEVVDMRELRTADERVARVRELTGGGADVVCELVGRAEALAEGLQMAALGGRYLEIGTFYPGSTVPVDPGLLVMRNLRVEAVASYDARSLELSLSFLERHAGRLPLDQVLADYPLEAINDAFADQDAGRVTRASLVTA